MKRIIATILILCLVFIVGCGKSDRSLPEQESSLRVEDCIAELQNPDVRSRDER